MSLFGVYETAAGGNMETDHPVRHSMLTFLFKLKQLVCNNSIYRLEDADALNFPFILSLLLAYDKALLLVFSEWVTADMETFKIEKPVPPPLYVVNLYESTSSLVGQVNPISTIFQENSLMFGQDY